VTIAENTARGISLDITKIRHATRTHCKNGHELTPENSYSFEEDGYIRRKCKLCKRGRRR
jgi:hypothetical protein